MKEQKKVNPLATESEGKLIAKFAIPAIISMLVSSLYNIVDQIFIGQGVGLLGNAATNIAFPVSIICTATALLLGIGSASNFNLCSGAGELPTASAIMGDVIDVIRDIQYHCTGRISCTCYRDTPVKDFKEVKNKFYIRMLVDNKPGVLAAIASVFGVHKVSIARVIQKTEADDAAELVIVTEAVKEKHLEDALEHLADMDTTREIGTVIREY